MPSAVPTPVRQQLWLAAQQGQDVPSLAQRFGLAPRTVRRLLGRFRSGGPVPPTYHRGGAAVAPGQPDLRAHARGLRDDHPRWGAGLIRLYLRRRFPQAQPPSERTVQRWLRGAAPAASPGRRPAAERRRAQWPHDTWQMDAADQLRLASGRLVSWLRLVDECSGAVLQTVVFPPRLGPGAGRRRAARPARPVRPLGPPAALPGG